MYRPLSLRKTGRRASSPIFPEGSGERTAGPVPKKRLVNELNPFLASEQHLHLGESRYWRSRESLARALSLSSLRLPYMENLFAGWAFSSSDYAIMINFSLLMNNHRKRNLDTNLCKLKFCWRLSFLLRQTSSTQCWAASESKNCQKQQITKNNKLKLSGVKCTQNYSLYIKISDSTVLYSF